MNWIKAFSQKFHSELNQKEKITKELAVSALLIEMMQIDGKVDDNEQEFLFTVLEQQFSMEREDIRTLITEAGGTLDKATDYYQFTHVLNENMTIEEKISIVEKFWGMASVDGHVDAYEQHIIRKLADLLHLRRSEYITAKNNGLKS